LSKGIGIVLQLRLYFSLAVIDKILRKIFKRS